MWLRFNKSFKLRTWPPRNLFALANTLDFALFKSQRSYSHCYNCTQLVSLCCRFLHASSFLQSSISSVICPGNCICFYTLANTLKYYNRETYTESIDNRNANIVKNSAVHLSILRHVHSHNALFSSQ